MRDTLPSRISNFIISTAYVVIIPSFLIFIAHFFFVSSYTGIFTLDLFQNQYTSGIFRYRILGRELVLIFTQLNENLFFNNLVPYGVDDHIANFYAPLYWGYFQVNYLFFIATCFTWWIGLKSRSSSEYVYKINYITLVLASFIGMSVVVPYDMISYFILSVSITIFHIRYRLAIPLLIVVTILGTLTRESQALAITYAGIILVVEGTNKYTILKFLSIIITFLSTYLGLRIWYGFSSGVSEGSTLIVNITDPLNLIGVFGMISFCLLFWDITSNSNGISRLDKLVGLFSFPYLAMILFVGNASEFRLIVPVLIVISFVKLQYYDKVIQFRLFDQISTSIKNYIDL